MDVVIIGAGVSGLCIGRQLVEKGLSCLILEKKKEIGGLARACKQDGFTFDIGPHFIFGDGCPEAVKFLKSIVKNQCYVVPQRIACYYSGRYFAWPPMMKDLFKYPLKTILYHVFRPFLTKKTDHKSFEEEMILQHGRQLYDLFFSPYLYKKLGGKSGKEIHKDWWLRPLRTSRSSNIELPPFKRNLLNSSLLLAQKILFGSRQVLYYPYNGFQDIVFELRKEFLEKGGIIKTGVQYIRLGAATDNTIKDLIVDNEVIPLKALVSTAPIQFSAELLRVPCPDDLQYTDIIVYFVKLRRKALGRNKLYIYYADNDIIFNRLYFPSNINEALVPEGKDGVCVEFTARNPLEIENPSLLKERIVKDLVKVGICQEDDVEDISFESIKNAIPTYTINYRELLYEFFSKVYTYENIWLAGRTGAFYNVLTDGVVRSSLEVAREIQQKLGRTK